MAEKLLDFLFAATSYPKAKGAKLVEALGILSDLQAGKVSNKIAPQLRESRISHHNDQNGPLRVCNGNSPDTVGATDETTC